jgi:hypothetical protein
MKALLQGLWGHPENVVRRARNYPCADVPGKRAATPSGAGARRLMFLRRACTVRESAPWVRSGYTLGEGDLTVG